MEKKSDKHLIEKLVRKNPVYRGNSVDFCVDEILLHNGRKAVREYLDHPGAVGVVPKLIAGARFDPGSAR